jgi:hypothetical protein
MNSNIRLFSTVTLLVTGILVACGPSDAAKRRADSAVAASTRAHVVSQAGEVLGARREAQTFFDSARSSFLLNHRAAASNGLREAAAFAREQAERATGLDKDGLANSAKELDRLATAVGSRSVKSVKTLDYAFARTHVAEAQYHYTRMLAAWNKHDGGVAGAELTMAIDHLDRGVRDAGLRLASEAQATLADVRSLAGEMTKGSVLVAAHVEKTLTSFDAELQGITTLVAKKR